MNFLQQLISNSDIDPLTPQEALWTPRQLSRRSGDRQWDVLSEIQKTDE